MQLRQSGTHSNLEVAFRQEALDKPSEVAHETENAVLPHCVVGFLKVKEIFIYFILFFVLFLTKAFLINISKQTR